MQQELSIIERHWELKDEWANSLTHGVGFIFSLIGFFYLIKIALEEGNMWKLAAFLIYGCSLVLLYAISTLYHSFKSIKLKSLFRLFDHCAIYILIAGSYTPITLLSLPTVWSWTIFSVIWSLAILGIVFKVFFIHRFETLSTLLYLFMGWLIVIAAEPILTHVQTEALYWLAGGGAAYTGGVIFFVFDKTRFFHAIWHIFVLGGSACHYFAFSLYL